MAGIMTAIQSMLKINMDKGEPPYYDKIWLIIIKLLSAKGWMGYNWPVEYGGTGWSATQLYLL